MRPTTLIRELLLGLALALGLAAVPASAQLRTLPAEAKRGEIGHVQEAQVEINGKAMRLSPGAQIRDESNRIVLPAALPPGRLVKYLLDGQGQVHRVWILSPREAAEPDPKK